MTKHVTRAGRPPKDQDERMQLVHVRLPLAMVAAIDGLAEHRVDRPDRSHMIRELLADALALKGKGRR